MPAIGPVTGKSRRLLMSPIVAPLIASPSISLL
jgi:hypothetical protein